MKNSLLEKFGLMVCWLGMLAITATAQTTSRIIDLNGQAVSGVEIKVDGYCVNRGNIGTGSATITRQTNSNGEFAWDLPCSGSDSGSYTFTFTRAGYAFTRGGSLRYAYNNRGSFSPVPVPIDERLPVIYAAPTTIAKWKPVSAADYADAGIANEMILAGFGNGIAALTAAATLPLPTTLGARKIVVRDMNGKEAAGRFFFVSPNQINFVMPNGLAEGACAVKLLDGADNVRFVDLPVLSATRPSLFTANADGKGVPAAQIVRVKPGNVQSIEPLAQFDQVQKKWVPLPIDLGPDSERVFLILYGTGWRNYPTTGLKTFVQLGETDCEVTYVGAQPTQAGLDQINVLIPRSLIGRGEVNLTISSIADNSTFPASQKSWPLKIK